MPEIIHTTRLTDEDVGFGDESKPTMIDVADVTMVFNIANQQLNSFKEYFIALAKRQLFFREFTALSDVSLTVKKGDVFGILGTNGSGKSTLLKIIAGVLEPTHGTVTINGHIAPLIELGAGFDMELTARENIYLNGSLLGYPRKFIAQHFDNIVDFAEIRSFLDMPLKNYSSGMVARIAFAIATVIVPEILIVDEVLSVGDFMFQQKCEERIQKLITEYGTTVLIVSHSNDQIERLCNKALWIEKGHTRLLGPASDVCQAYRALGGHVGSAASEERIFELLQEPLIVPEKFYATIEGPDIFEVTARLATALDKGSIPGVVFAPVYDDLPRYIALGFFRALGYVPLLTPFDELPNSVSLALKRLEPREVIFLERDAFPFSEAVAEAVAELCPGVKIRRYTSVSTDEMAFQSVEALGEAGVQWTRRAVAISPFCHRAYAERLNRSALAEDDTFTAHEGRPLRVDPVLYIDQLDADEAALAGQIDTQLGYYGPIEEVLLIGDRLTSGACPRLFEERGCRVRLWEDAADGSGEAPGEGALVEAPRPEESVSLIVMASEKNAEAALSAAPLACRLRMPLVFEQHDDLDSITHAIDVVETFEGTVDGLLFIGDGTCFEKIDKEVLAKCAIRARIAHGLVDEERYRPATDALETPDESERPVEETLLTTLSSASLRW